MDLDRGAHRVAATLAFALSPGPHGYGVTVVALGHSGRYCHRVGRLGVA
jgi:hypothetical protein